jgi:hypothetical protein
VKEPSPIIATILLSDFCKFLAAAKPAAAEIDVLA